MNSHCTNKSTKQTRQPQNKSIISPTSEYSKRKRGRPRKVQNPPLPTTLENISFKTATSEETVYRDSLTQQILNATIRQ